MKIIAFISIFIGILLMSIGYASLNTELTISGEAAVQVEQNIKITNITILQSEGNATTSYNPSFTNTTSNIDVILPNQTSKITLIIEVTNNTDNYYHLDDVIENNNTNYNITYEIKDKEIIYFPERSTQEIEITFYYDNVINTNTEISLGLNYIFEDIIYEKLEYITFTGTQYVDTGVLNTGDYIFETDFMQTALTNNDGGWIFNGRSSYNYAIGVFAGKYGIFNGYGAITQSSTPSATLSSWYSMYYSRSEFYINDSPRTVVGKKLIPSEYERTILIAGATISHSGTPDTRHFIGNIKCFKITDATDGVVLRYFVPAKITEGPNTGQIGYWDIIEDKFYQNAGTGTLTGM